MRIELRRDLLVWLFFTALTLAFTWPWILHPGALLGGMGDSWEYLWKLSWFKEQVLAGRNPFSAPHVFYPFGYNLAASHLSLVPMATGLLLSIPFGETLAYNLLILAAFVIAGATMFSLVRDLTNDPAAALVAGVIFAYTPFMSTRALGHIPLMGYCFLPLLARALHGLGTEAARKHIWPALVALLLITYSTMYLTVIVVIGMLVWFFLARPPERSWGSWLRAWLPLAGGLVAICLPVFAIYYQATTTGVSVGHWSIRDIRGAPPLALFLPSNLNPFFGPMVRPILGEPALTLENNASLGIVGILLGLFALRAGGERRELTRAGFGLVLVGAILTLGPILMRNARDYATLPIAIPEALRAKLGISGRAQHLPVPLPGALLALLPGFGGIRSFQRFVLLANLGTALLAGLGFRALTAGMGRAGRSLLAVGAVLLTLLEFNIWPFESSRLPPRPVDRWLRDQPGQFTILDFPVTSSENGPHMYYTRFHGKRIAGGYTSFYSRAYRDQVAQYNLLPDSAALPALRRADIRYVLVDTRADTAARLDAFLSSPNFRLATNLDRISVFALSDSAPRATLP